MYKFELPDMNGNIIRLDSLKGKIVVADFWFTGCINCVAIHPNFENVVDHFSDNPNVVFVSISVDQDRDTWLKSVREGSKLGYYTNMGKKNLLNLYTAGMGRDHPMVTYHRVHGYPTLLMIGPDGRVEIYPTDPRRDRGKGMIQEINAILERVDNRNLK